MNTRQEGIDRLRALADELESDNGLALAVQWIRTKVEPANIESMDFGHPIIADAMAMHALRVRVHYGPQPAPIPTETKQ